MGSRPAARFPENAIQLSSCNFANVDQRLVLFLICAMIITESFAKEQAIPWHVFFILSRRLCGIFAIICKDVDIKHQKNAVFHPFRRFLRATTWRINRKIIFRGASRIMRESSEGCNQLSWDYGKSITESPANEHVTAWQVFVTLPGCLSALFEEIFRIADLLQQEKATFHPFRRF